MKSEFKKAKEKLEEMDITLSKDNDPEFPFWVRRKRKRIKYACKTLEEAIESAKYMERNEIDVRHY